MKNFEFISEVTERLGIVLVVDAPWIFSGFYKFISPFIASTTVKKIVFVTGQKEKEEILTQYIEKVQVVIHNFVISLGSVRNVFWWIKRLSVQS